MTGLILKCCWIFNEALLVLPVCQDGTVIVHTVRRGQFLRTLRPPNESCIPTQISGLQVGMEGHIVVQTSLEERSNKKARPVNIYFLMHSNVRLLFSFRLCHYPNVAYSCRASTPFMFTQWTAVCCLLSPWRSRWLHSTWCLNMSSWELFKATSTFGTYTGKEMKNTVQC